MLGAVVSPTDAVAPAEILRRLGAPRTVINVVEGENLTNDWTALVAYKFAVAAVVTGSFSLAEAVPEFFLTGLGGIGDRNRRRGRHRRGAAADRRPADARSRSRCSPPTPPTFRPRSSGLSGVIAAVTAGVWLGWQASELTTHTTRLQLTAVWSTLQFLLNAVLFVLVGLQLPGGARRARRPLDRRAGRLRRADLGRS